MYFWSRKQEFTSPLTSSLVSMVRVWNNINRYTDSKLNFHSPHVSQKACSTSLCHPALKLSHWDVPHSLWGFCHNQLTQRKLKVCYCSKCREWKVKITQTKAQRLKDPHGHQHTKNSLPVSPTSTCYHLAYSPEDLMKKCVTFLTYRRFFMSSPDPAADLS